jgi:hypothetical protein
VQLLLTHRAAQLFLRLGQQALFTIYIPLTGKQGL